MMKSVLAILCLVLTSMLGFPAHSFSAWPERPVTFILASQAGTSLDVVGRILADALSKRFNQPFVIKNTNSGSLGGFPVAMKNAKNDGYVIGMCGDGAFTYNSLRQPNYTADDVEYVCGVFYGDSAWVVAGGNTQWKDVKDALEWAKANNKTLNYMFHTGMDRDVFSVYAKQIGAKVNLIPATGPAAILTSLIGGHADIGFSGGLHVEQERAGKIRTLTTVLDKRSPHYPDVPNHTELFNPFYHVPMGLRIIVVPKGFPPVIKTELGTALKEIIDSADFKGIIENRLHYIPYYMNSEELTKFIHEQLEACKILAKKVNEK